MYVNSLNIKYLKNNLFNTSRIKEGTFKKIINNI